MIDFDVTYSAERINLTESILSSIATHLAQKKSCRRKTYRVAIGMYDAEQNVCRQMFYSDKGSCYNFIFFDCDARIKEHSTYGRRFEEPAIQHIIIKHFPDVWAGAANGNQVQIKHWMLIPGIYEYRLSASGKYRKWFKVA